MVPKKEWLINLRNKLELTQEQVATKAGISRVYYNLIESGERTPSVRAAKLLSKVFDVNWWIFFKD
jgi:transcriptional regulator with XRE-family HTH domain